MKIVTIIGARPQFVKAAVISRAIKELNHKSNKKVVEEIIVHTGQHYDANMSDIFFTEMNIPRPDYHLGVGGTSHASMTGQMLEKIEKILIKEKPDVVMVYGDTNSTLAGALTAAKMNIPVAHVEAGLRSFNMNMPEEINRIVTDRISKWLFCPTETAVMNLNNEGVSNWPGTKVYCSGDVMYDAALFYKDIAIPTELTENLIKDNDKAFYLATIHRAENTDDPKRLDSILCALCEIAQKTPVILPLHPRTKRIVHQHFSQHSAFSTDQLIIIDPIGYFDMLALLANCKAVFTDSGGVQKEAYFFKKTCITLRDETEWIELIDNGFNILVGADRDKIITAEKEFACLPRDFSMSLYGDGNAGAKILDLLLQNFNNS